MKKVADNDYLILLKIKIKQEGDILAIESNTIFTKIL